MKNLTLQQTTELKNEFEILRNVIQISRQSQISKSKQLEIILSEIKKSKYYTGSDAEIDFHTWNTLNNNLPEMSSGSYFTALTDISYLVENSGYNSEENESKEMEIYQLFKNSVYTIAI